MARAPRQLTHSLEWFPAKRCFRFRFRDPFTGKRKYLYCTPGRFEQAGIALSNPEAVRKQTKKAEALASKLRTTFLASLGSVRPPAEGDQRPPVLSRACDEYFSLYSQSPRYRASLKRLFEEFREVVGDKRFDRVTDKDLKAFEESLAQRVQRVTVRSYMRQLFMLINFACKKQWVLRDPRLTYRLPKEELKEPDPFSQDELEQFFKVVRQPVSHHPKGWEFVEWMGVGMLCLGLRPIELEHARWEDVNWDERFLFVRRSHPNKMPQACQNQPIPLSAWPLFKARKQPSGLVWTSYYGRACTPGVQSKARTNLQKSMPSFQWKRFRKTFATMLEQEGNDVVLVSRLLRQSAGGKNVTVAQRHYIGKSHAYLRRVVDDAFAHLSGLGPFP